MPSPSAAARKLTEKWIRNPSDRAAVAAGCYFDQAAADHVCNFVETFLRHSIGRWAARPFLLEPWQRDYLSRLFGWKRANGYRRFRETYLEVPKKNGKSSLLAAVALYLIFEEPGAEVYLGAVNRKQARIIFAECSRMVASSPALRKHLHVIDTQATITFPRMNSKMEAMSADVAGKDGMNSSACILDECHRFKSRGLYDVMKYAGVARQQSLLINITTAGTDRHSLCYQLHTRALAVLDGTVDEIDFLPVVYAADPDRDDLDDPRIWKKANPSLGVIISEDDFRSEYEQAKRIPSQLNNFLRLRLNIWTEAASRWLPFDLWDAGNNPIDPAELEGLPCYAGLDLSSVKDLTALSLVFPIGDRYRLVSYCWMPEETASERAEADGVSYPEWIRAGHMIETPGNATDFGAIRSRLGQLRQHHNILSVGLDPWNAQSLCNDLIDDEFEVVEIRQVFANLTGPAKELERLLLGGLFDHDGSPVTRWAVGNCATTTDAQGNIMPSKKRSPERIDPVASLVNALALAHRDKPGPKSRISLLTGQD